MGQGVVVKVVNLDLPADLPGGNYSAYSIAVQEGANLLEQCNWIAVDGIRFGFVK